MDTQMNNDQALQDLSEQARIRREKLQTLKDAGQDPYAITKYDRSHLSKEIIDDYSSLEGQRVSIAGRMLSRRIMGKASFLHLQDHAGRIQAYVKRDTIGQDAYQAFKSLDIGDILGITGKVFTTKTGEVSIEAESYTLLTKSLLPLPEKFHGLTDPDARYRQRYVDLIMNPEVKETFLKRSRILQALRAHLDGLGFIEVDTPILHTLETGASARPFVTHHNALDIDMYMRIETELHLKRLIVGGFDAVYEVGRLFRNEGMDAYHNPEFTTIELYKAYIDYNDLMELVENMYASLAQQICGSTKITYQGIELDLTPPWNRITMADAVKKYAGLDYNEWTDDADARAKAKAAGIHVEENFSKGEVLEACFDEKAEHHLVQPTFLIDYPVEISPLAKRKPENPALTERFEFFIAGHEYGNAFTELNDPIDQRERFEKQVAIRKQTAPTAQVDEDFVTALEYGMPPTGGLGFGVDRLIMLLTNQSSIRDVLLFPTMKPHNK